MSAFSQPTPFEYLETPTIPVGMTMSEFRVARPAAPGRVGRVVAALRRFQHVDSPAATIRRDDAALTC